MALNRNERCDFVFSVRVVHPDSLVCICEEQADKLIDALLLLQDFMNAYPGHHFTVFDESYG